MEKINGIPQSRGRRMLEMVVNTSEINHPDDNVNSETNQPKITKTVHNTEMNHSADKVNSIYCKEFEAADIFDESNNFPDLNISDFDLERMEVDDDALFKAADDAIVAGLLQEHSYYAKGNTSSEQVFGVKNQSGDQSFETCVEEALIIELPHGENITDNQINVESGPTVDISHEIIARFEEAAQGDNTVIVENQNNDPSINNKKRARSKKPITSKWIKLENKEKRKRGEAYSGVKKINDKKWQYDIVRPAKKIKEHCGCSMSKISSKINCTLFKEDDRQILFNNFWKGMDWDQRKTHINDMVDSDRPKDNKNKIHDVSRRGSTFLYHLKLNNERIRVCKKLFLNTYGITDWVVLSWIKQKVHGDTAINEEDEENNCKEIENMKRMRTKRSVRIIKKSLFVREFLNSLPKIESHYCRRDTKKLYLEPLFQTKRAVYDLYKKRCMESNREVASIKKFHEEFDAQNLSIYRPRKDQCDLCTSYRMKNVDEETYKNHINKKESARAEKSNDNQSTGHVLTVDKEAILLSPSLKASALYYKSKLVVHNYTVFNNKNKDVVCYVWHEGEGGVTSNEFATLITHQIEDNLKPSPNDTVIIWSDGCGYQNKNINLTNALLMLSEKLNITIVQKFLERGHTQMECDSIHAQIEKKLKNREIFVPYQYVEIMKVARKYPKPYVVEYLNHSFFMDFSHPTIYTSIRPGMKTGETTVSEVCALKCTPERKVFYKLRFENEWIELEKRKKRKQISFEEPIKLYAAPLKIKPAKFKHLQELKCVIPKDYHAFYDLLKQ